MSFALSIRLSETELNFSLDILPLTIPNVSVWMNVSGNGFNNEYGLMMMCLDVFNTECHPFKAPPAKAVYGSGSIKSPSSGVPFQSRPGPPGPAISPGPFVQNNPPQ